MKIANILSKVLAKSAARYITEIVRPMNDADEPPEDIVKDLVKQHIVPPHYPIATPAQIEERWCSSDEAHIAPLVITTPDQDAIISKSTMEWHKRRASHASHAGIQHFAGIDYSTAMPSHTGAKHPGSTKSKNDRQLGQRKSSNAEASSSRI